MIASRDDAEGLLRKWTKETIPVSVMLITGDVVVSFSGFIKFFLAENAFTVEHRDNNGNKIVDILVSLAGATQFEYSDVREAAPDIREKLSKRMVASLMIHFGETQLNLAELVI
jgi:hypothetical protein